MGLAVNLTVYGLSDVGRVRAKNEDAFVIADLMVSQPIHAMQRPLSLDVGDRGTLLAVSDGMGGARAGEVASALALHALREGMMNDERKTAEAALQESVERANKDVFDASAAAGRKGMGATLTAVFISANRAYIAEVGDSRAYLLRGDRFVPLTHDQSCVQLLLDAGTLTRAEAETFQYKNIILQSIGTQPSVVVAMNRVTLRRKDRILLCSDGLSGKVTDAEMQAALAGSGTVDEICTQLVAMANARGGEDNITALLAEVDGEGLPVSAGDGRVSLEKLQEFHA